MKTTPELINSILKSVERENGGGELICKRISTACYITDECTVGDAAEIFTGNSGMQALGVADINGKATGVIIRNELFSLIGQMFGRELYLNKSIKDVVRPAEMIYYKRNTFSVIDELSDELRSVYNRFYILIDTENSYRGLISTFDLVLFLSDMMTRELKAARRIHSAIVRDEIYIESRRMSVAGYMMMAGETGGDFQYVREIGDKRWFISLCDVSGKGLNAGLISVAVSSMYAAYDFSSGIDGLICRINSYIHGLFDGEIFLTGIFIDFNEITGELDLYDMGHSMVYLLKEGTAAQASANNDNLPLGIKKELVPVKAKLRLGQGDMLLSYTDGLPEQINLADKCFGEQKILSLAMKYRKSAIEQIKNIVFEELKSWRFGNAQGDDMSLLIMKYM